MPPLTREQILKMKSADLVTENFVVMQDAAQSLDKMQVAFSNLHAIELEKIRLFPSPTPRLNVNLVEETDNFTQSVCNTYRVVIKPLIINKTNVIANN